MSAPTCNLNFGCLVSQKSLVYVKWFVLTHNPVEMPTARSELVIDDVRPPVGVLLAGSVLPVLDSIAAQVGVKSYLSVLSEML